VVLGMLCSPTCVELTLLVLLDFISVAERCYDGCFGGNFSCFFSSLTAEVFSVTVADMGDDALKFILFFDI
jgi:hypothetical protein